MCFLEKIMEDIQKTESTQKKKVWYKKWWGILIVLAIWPYFLLWYVWAKTDIKKKYKILLTIILVVFIFFINKALKPIRHEEKSNTEKLSKEIPNETENISAQQDAVKEISADEKAKQEEARQARILASEEAEKKKEERRKAQVQAEEDRKNALAEKYCVERKDDSTSFTVFDVSHISTENKTKRYSMEGLAHKKGPQLTANDCRKIIDFMQGWGIEKIQEISERKYWIGMSGIELTLSAGIPNDINTDNYGSGERGQWIYHKDSYGISSYYFYVENNKVTSYQDY